MFIPDHFGSPGTSSPTPAAQPSHVAWLRNKFLAGLALVVPLILTFWIMRFVYDVLHGYSQPMLMFVVEQLNAWFSPKAAEHYADVITAYPSDWQSHVGDLPNQLLIDPLSPGYILFERCVGVLIPVLVLFGLGVMGTHVIGVRVVEAFDRLLLRIPFISFIYKSLRQVMDAFKGLGGKSSFKRVVYVDYPSTGAWMLGFVTGGFYDRLKQKSMTCLFVPGALSPMTGLLLIVESERVVDAPMTVEEAMKMIFSGGLVAPNSDATPRGNPEPTPPTVLPGDALPAGLPRADDLEQSAESEAPAAALVPAASEAATSTSTSRFRLPWGRGKARV